MDSVLEDQNDANLGGVTDDDESEKLLSSTSSSSRVWLRNWNKNIDPLSGPDSV